MPVVPAVLNRFMTLQQTGHFGPRSSILKTYFRMWRFSLLAFLSRIVLITTYILPVPFWASELSISSHVYLDIQMQSPWNAAGSGGPRTSFSSFIASESTLPLVADKGHALTLIL